MYLQNSSEFMATTLPSRGNEGASGKSRASWSVSSAADVAMICQPFLACCWLASAVTCLLGNIALKRVRVKAEKPRTEEGIFASHHTRSHPLVLVMVVRVPSPVVLSPSFAHELAFRLSDVITKGSSKNATFGIMAKATLPAQWLSSKNDASKKVSR